jgi:ABC-type polysaccharide/polyol phosphate transport system ATPase subunit
MNDHELAVVADRVGVQYDLQLGQSRSLASWAKRLAKGRREVGADQRFWALRDVSFGLRRGEVLGVVGRNGSGKSTLLLVLAQLLRPDEGSVHTFGRRTSLLTLGAGFETELSGRDNIYLNATLLGLTKREIESRIDEIIDFSELGAFIDVPIRKYSVGMRQRLAFSIAVQAEPDVLLLDEVLGSGDLGFQEKSRAKLQELMENATAIVLVSHGAAAVQEMCTTALWLHEGKVIAHGDPEDIAPDYSRFIRAERGPVRTPGGAAARPLLQE